MVLEILEQEFSVLKLSAGAVIPCGVCFLAHTDTETSLVCETRYVDFPAEAREDGWRALRVAGALDFSLIGILARITGVLAESEISVFCVSTYDTDYILVRSHALAGAVRALTEAGYNITKIAGD